MLKYDWIPDCYFGDDELPRLFYQKAGKLLHFKITLNNYIQKIFTF